MIDFLLNGMEYVELNKLLKNLSLVGSGGEAKLRILGGEAIVNGKVETQIRKKLRQGDKVQFDGNEVLVKA